MYLSCVCMAQFSRKVLMVLHSSSNTGPTMVKQDASIRLSYSTREVLYLKHVQTSLEFTRMCSGTKRQLFDRRCECMLQNRLMSFYTGGNLQYETVENMEYTILRI